LHVLARYACRHVQTTIREFFDALLAEDDSSAIAWRAFRDELFVRSTEFASALGARLSEAELDQMLALLMVPILRNAFRDFDTQSRFFTAVESMGYHVLPAHFYSPVPNLTELTARDWEQKLGDGLDFNAAEQLTWLADIAPWLRELGDVPNEPDAERPHQYHWNNPSFGALDASVYYGVIRRYEPERVIEVGGGFSTLIAAQAVRMFPLDRRPRFTCIEPYPLEMLAADLDGLYELIQQPVQSVPLTAFSQLSRNDVLFIDSSHVSKAGSDVNYLLLEVLPQLRSGVVVHIHDIFLPWDYPREWVFKLRNFWNEQYLVHALLACGSAFEVLAGNWFLSQERGAEVAGLLKDAPVTSGASLWIQRR
jgi:Methyltransferase domain